MKQRGGCPIGSRVTLADGSRSFLRLPEQSWAHILYLQDAAASRLSPSGRTVRRWINGMKCMEADPEMVDGTSRSRCIARDVKEDYKNCISTPSSSPRCQSHILLWCLFYRNKKTRVEDPIFIHRRYYMYCPSTDGERWWRCHVYDGIPQKNRRRRVHRWKTPADARSFLLPPLAPLRHAPGVGACRRRPRRMCPLSDVALVRVSKRRPRRCAGAPPPSPAPTAV